MGAIDQLVSASLAALFSIGMLIASHAFIEYRSARSPAVNAIQPIRLFSHGARIPDGPGFDGAL
jgi:hypothetical protein